MENTSKCLKAIHPIGDTSKSKNHLYFLTSSLIQMVGYISSYRIVVIFWFLRVGGGVLLTITTAFSWNSPPIEVSTVIFNVGMAQGVLGLVFFVKKGWVEVAGTSKIGGINGMVRFGWLENMMQLWFTSWRHTLDGRNPAPPGMYKALYIMG